MDLSGEWMGEAVRDVLRGLRAPLGRGLCFAVGGQGRWFNRRVALIEIGSCCGAAWSPHSGIGCAGRSWRDIGALRDAALTGGN